MKSATSKDFSFCEQSLCSMQVVFKGILPTKEPLSKLKSFLSNLQKVEVLVAQSCAKLCDATNCSLAHSSVHGIFQAIILEQVAISFSRGFPQPKHQTQISCIAGIFFTVWATSLIV